MKVLYTIKNLQKKLLVVLTAATSVVQAQDFTIVTLPDIQNMTWSPVDQNLYNEMNYIINNKDQMNTQFVVSLGDLTAGGYPNISSHDQWRIAKKSSDMLVNAGIPYAVCTGNHDMDYVPAYTIPLPLERFKQYYPVSEFEGKTYFGGYHRDMSNAYYLFSEAGMDFIIIQLQNYEESSYDPAVGAWANQVLTNHKDRRAIISTHMLYKGNEYMTEIIERHDNVFMAVYGHSCNNDGEMYWTTQTPSGNTIHCLMSDYQCRYNEGGGAVLRYYTFLPSENRVQAYTYSTYRKAFETDQNSQFSFDYLMVLPEEPLISQLSNFPKYPKSDQSCEIRVDARDNKGINDVILHWGTNPNELINTINMNVMDDFYAASIPKQADQTVVYYQVVVSDIDGNTTTSEIANYQVENDVSKLPCPYNTNHDAFAATPHLLPGKIEAEDFDTGCEGVAYVDQDNSNQGGKYRSESVDIENCTDVGGGYNVGWTNSGESLTYTVEVSTSGYYDLEFRIAASTSGNGKLSIQVNDETPSPEVQIPATGGWQNWSTVKIENILLMEGTQVITILINEGGFNLNYFSGEISSIITGLQDNQVTASYRLVDHKMQLTGLAEKVRVKIFDMSGKLCSDITCSSSVLESDLSHLPKGLYISQIEFEDRVEQFKFTLF